jgi:murein DD-endopeptidase MepM/ murein hydrolase activator NlpD
VKTKFWLLLTGTTIALVSFFYLYSFEEQKETIKPIAIQKIEPEPTLLYGFPIDSFEVTTGKVRWNQFLSEILSNHNVSGQDLYTLSKVSKKVFDVRKLKAGAKYTIIHDKDSQQTVRQFIFEPSLTEFVVYNFVDSIHATLNQKPIEIKERTLAVEINSSMYEALLEQNASPILVNRLVDVFAWQVDFFRIAKGDKLKVVFEEQSVDGEISDIGEIKAAYFEHWGKEYYAIPYDHKEKIDFFDEEGKSLRKTFLRAPLNFSRISSRYSPRRFHPVQKRYKAHLGTDYAAPTGTPIRTVGDGVVLEARYHGGNGNYVKIKHNSNYTTQYLHMSKIARGIRPGVRVKQGKTIGYVGQTGLANGPHLCFRFWKNGRQVDALKVDLPASKGIDKASLEAFKIHSDSVKRQLDLVQFPAPEPLFAYIKYPLPNVD